MRYMLFKVKLRINMLPRQHQVEVATWALATIRVRGFAYLAMQERTGKTLAALLTVENSLCNTCLVITKKKAIDGWLDTLEQWDHKTTFKVINYESIHRIQAEYDFIILDEAHHAISSVGRPSKTWKAVHKHTYNKPILYLSATPYAEHLGLIYHQLKLSCWAPFKEKNFYEWFRAYGISKMVRTPYGLVETYTKYKDGEILNILQPYFIFMTRKEVGMEHEPTVNLVVVPLLQTTKDVILQTIKDEMLILPGVEEPIDSPMKMRMVHYQLEGGTIKLQDRSLCTTSGQEKLSYIEQNYVQKDIAIMAHFIQERKLLKLKFPHAKIYSADGHAEGVDLSAVSKLIIYSMSFKTSKYAQRLARQANHNRKEPIVVDILVADNPGIGKAVYEAVALKKVNFDKNSYDRTWNES